MKNIFQRVFPVFSLIILLLFIAQLWKNYNRPYLKYQKEFKDLLLQKGTGEAEIANFEFGVQQRWIKELDRIDRCETCHLGVEDPKFIDAPQPELYAFGVDPAEQENVLLTERRVSRQLKDALDTMVRVRSVMEGLETGRSGDA